MFLLVDKTDPRFCVYDPLRLIVIGWLNVLDEVMSERSAKSYEVGPEFLPRVSVFPIEFFKNEGDCMGT